MSYDEISITSAGFSMICSDCPYVGATITDPTFAFDQI